MKTHLMRLQEINERLEQIRPKVAQAASNYETEKAAYQILESKYFKEMGNLHSAIEKERMARNNYQKEYDEYHRHKGNMVAYDREVKILDIERSNIQSILKSMENN